MDLRTRQRLSNIFGKLEQVSGVAELADRFNGTEKDTEIATIERQIPVIRDVKKSKNARERSQKKVRRTNLRLLAHLKSKAKLSVSPNLSLARPCGFIPADLFFDCYTATWDKSGRAIRELCNQCSNKIAIARLHRSALDVDEDGNKRYTYYGDSRGSVRARNIFAVGWLLLKMSERRNRKGQWNRLVRGVTQSAMLSMLSGGRIEQRLCSTTLSGTHRRGTERDEIGYIDALKRGGFLYAHQAKWKGDKPPKGWENLDESERGGTKGDWNFSVNRYWVITDRFTDSRDSETRSKLWVDWMAGSQPAEVWLTSSVPICADDNEKTCGFCHNKPPP